MPSRPLRVLVASTRLPRPGTNETGTPAHVRKSVAALRARGVEASLAAVDPGCAPQPLGLARATAQALTALRGARADVVHVHGHLAAIPLLPAARLLGVPVVVEVHGAYAPSLPGQAGARPRLSRLGAAAEFPVLRRADHVVAQARAMAGRIAAGGVDPARITVLYPGLRTAEFSDPSVAPAEVPGAPAGRPLAMYVGSTHAYQGLELLAAAQRRLAGAVTVVLVLSSDGGPSDDPVARMGFDPGSTVVLRPDDPGRLPALLAAASVLVHSRPDCPDSVNVQSKLGLYLASGRPVAATDVGDYRTLLGPSRGCRLAPPDPDRVAAAILAAAGDPDVARFARVDNPAIARRHFESSESTARLVRLYEGLVPGHRRARLTPVVRSAP